MKKFSFILLAITLMSCSATKNNLATKEQDEAKISTILNAWHKAAAEANFETYFSHFTSDAIFIGTDASEIWNKQEFETYAKPYFDKGKAWSFTPLKRHIYFSKDYKTAWFDELLDTQMELCRGSGVLTKTSNGWKIKHYVLSMTIPNENAKVVIEEKKTIEQAYKAKL